MICWHLIIFGIVLNKKDIVEKESTVATPYCNTNAPALDKGIQAVVDIAIRNGWTRAEVVDRLMVAWLDTVGMQQVSCRFPVLSSK